MYYDGDYEKDRLNSDILLPQAMSFIEHALPPQQLFTIECGEEDMFCATDLMTKQVRVAVRIREHYAYKEHPLWREEFTVRYKRKSGNKTEFQKIMEGYGDYIFYAFKDESGENFIKATLGDLHAFRRFVINEISKKGFERFVNARIKENIWEFGSEFLVFKINEIPDFEIATTKGETND